jgi:hypothetical protein
VSVRKLVRPFGPNERVDQLAEARTELRHLAHRYHVLSDGPKKDAAGDELEDAAVRFAIAKLNVSAVLP